MFRTTIAGLRAHKLRLVATALAIVLGVGFVAGTLIFGDTAKAALFDQFARAAKNVDVAASPRDTSRKQDGQAPTLPLSTVDKVRAVPGVSTVAGRMQAYLPLLDKHGKLVGNSDDPGVTLSAGTVPALREYDVTSGRVPATSGEAALDADTVARTHYALGDHLTVLDQHQGKHQLTLVGVISFGTSKAYADQAVVVLPEADLAALTGTEGYRQVVATAAPGVSPADLATRVAAALGADVQVVTGDAYRIDLANNAINQVQPFLTVLLVFAVIACVVAAFVIYNTFTILVAQRVRELALLRCVGASRGQVFRSVLLESAVVGLLGAAAGIGLGLAVAYGLFSGADALGAPLPAHALVLTGTPALVALVLGLVVTVGSAVVPAFRATRVAPLAALRVTPLARIRSRWGRTVLVALAVLTGGAGTLLTLRGHGLSDFRTGTLMVVAGGIVNFVAVLLLAPLFIGPLTGALGWLPGRVFGTPAKLASANARRNPGRAAATTAALMIGVGLMSAASVALATVQATVTHQIGAHYPVDYIIQPTRTGPQISGIPLAVADRLRAQSGLAVVARVRLDPAHLNGRGTVVGAVDPTGLAALPAPDLTAGSFHDFHDGTVVLSGGSDATKGHHVGDKVTVTTEDGRAGTFTVVGIATGQSLTGDVRVTWHDFAALHQATADDLVLVKAAPGVPPAASRTAVEAVTGDYPLVSVGSLASWRSDVTSAVDQIIAVIAALLGIAILIALIGIMNTLSLSVFERTRESAMLRALGLTRGQLRATLLVEALLMGVIGALVGVGFGVLYGTVTTQTMFVNITPIIAVPVGQLAGYVAIAALAGVLAAVLPARRAARASIVSAMADV
jgi:putative ABC transport system permease protein